MDTGPTRGRHGGPVVLFDRHCGFCDCSMRLLLRVDRRKIFRVAPLDGAYAAAVFERHPGLREVDSMVLVENVPASVGAETLSGDGNGFAERVSVRSTALLGVARRLGRAWRLLLIFALVPRPVRDWAYDVFAEHRGRLYTLVGGCPLPPPADGTRLLS